jgi:copper chaperone CopZ
MKKLTILMFLVIIISSCGNQPQTKEKTGKQEFIPDNLVKLRLDVKGMTCEGCENAIIRSLDRLEGVYEADASHENELVTLKYDPETADIEQISEAITTVGYKVAGVLEDGD